MESTVLKRRCNSTNLEYGVHIHSIFNMNLAVIPSCDTWLLHLAVISEKTLPATWRDEKQKSVHHRQDQAT